MNTQLPLDGLRDLLADRGIRHVEIARTLGISKSSFSRKMSGEHRITLVEAGEISAFLSRRLRRRVRIEDWYHHPGPGDAE